MALPGQASGDFTESSSSLRILYVGIRNSFAAKLTTDGFTQTNPPVITTAVSSTLPTAPKRGVLGGSVAFTRPDAGNGWVGGPTAAAPSAGLLKPLGIFINDADGNAYENTPAPASGQAPYLSGQGTYGTRLYETQVLAGAGTGTAGDDLFYGVGMNLYASVNGYLTTAASALGAVDETADLAEVAAGPGTAVADATVIGVVKIVPDSVHAELVYDQRI
jgi:hypothetical protein